MKKKHGFTMVELFAAVIILGILFAMGIWRLGNIGTDRYNAERCVNALYGKLSQFIMEAKTSKIPNGQDQIPDAYIFDMIDDIPNNTWRQRDDRLITGINLGYKYGDKIVETPIYLKDIPGCKDSLKYLILMTTPLGTGTMLPKLQGKGNQPGFLLEKRENIHYDSYFKQFSKGYNEDHVVTSGKVYTGSIDLNFCVWETYSIGTPMDLAIKNRIGNGAWYNNDCSSFAKFIFDTRTGILKRTYCKKINDHYRGNNQQRGCQERYSN